MSNKTNDMSLKERLIMVPKSFVAYKKDSVAISLSYLLPQKNPCVTDREIQITSTTKRPTLSQSKK